MNDHTPSTDEVRAEFVTNKAIRMPTTWRGADEFDRWLAAHDAEGRASVAPEIGMPCADTKPHPAHAWQMSATGWCLCAGVVAEEPEWETERVEEARIHYRYGVNSGKLAARNTPESIALAVEDHERRTMGRIGVEKIEARTKITRTSPWVPVKQEGAPS